MTPTQLHGLLEAQGRGTILFSLPFSLISGKVGLGKGSGESGSQNACLDAKSRGDEETRAGQWRHSQQRPQKEKMLVGKRGGAWVQGPERGRQRRKGRPHWPRSVRTNPGAK